MLDPLKKCFDDVVEENSRFETPRLRFRRAPPLARAWVDVRTGDRFVDASIAEAVVRSLRAARHPPAWKPAVPRESNEKDVGGVEVSGFLDRVAGEMFPPPLCLVVPSALIPQAGKDQRAYAARTLGFSQRFSVVSSAAAALSEGCPSHIFSGSIPEAVAAVAAFCATLDFLSDAPSGP